MKTELLILVPDDEQFCSSKKAFVDFLKVDSLLSITGQTISFRRTSKAKDIVSARFRIETDMVKSKQERYFLLILQAINADQIDEFYDLCERIRKVAERISPGNATINTLWDDVGRIYAEKSYPIINEVENLMRRLIAKFMLITVGMNWSKDTMDDGLFEKIERFVEEEPYLNDLYKLDFIQLMEVLFAKKRDIKLDELDRLLEKTDFNDIDKEKIKKYIPRSNWQKYFSALIEDRESSLDKKWELLYELRNKVAHNRHVRKEEYERIKGLSSKIKDIIDKAAAKLGEIDLNEEDRELIVYSYRSESPVAISYLSEKAVAEFYAKAGYAISSTEFSAGRRFFDFVASRNNEKIGVEVKNVRLHKFMSMMKSTVERHIGHGLMLVDENELTNVHLVVVLRESDLHYSLGQILAQAKEITESFSNTFEIHLGRINEAGIFCRLQE
jgi:hypothetical protein